MKDAVICLCVEEPDLSGLQEQDFDWSNKVYRDVKEMIPNEKPDPLGNCETLIHYYDANLYHDLTTGRSVTGILHLFNKTPMDKRGSDIAVLSSQVFSSQAS
jgi:hypothetical protein